MAIAPPPIRNALTTDPAARLMTLPWLQWLTALVEAVATGVPLRGEGSPEGVVTADVGRLYVRTDGGAGTVLYVKESGAGSTGWAAK